MYRALPAIGRLGSRIFFTIQTAKVGQRSFTSKVSDASDFKHLSGHQQETTHGSPHIIPRRRRKRIIVAITGATGAPLAVHLLQQLRKLGVETHVILSTWGLATLKYELDTPNNTASYIQSLADQYYPARDVSAAISSGSYRTDGMIVVPCSMKTLAGIRMGYDNDLITRAAGVTLKERRRLVLAARETPFSSIHLENMLEVTKAGAVIFPPMMTFYTRPKGVQDMVEQSVKRMIDLLDLRLEEHDESEGRWEGFEWKQKRIEEKQKMRPDEDVIRNDVEDSSRPHSAL